METIINIVSFILLIGLFLSPVFIVWRLNRLNVRYKFIIYLTICILTRAIIALTFGWWDNTSDQILLKHYGYNFDAMNDTERFGSVSSDNIERVKNLEKSIMGVGWQLKVIITYVFYSPYLLIVYLVTYLFSKKAMRTTDGI